MTSYSHSITSFLTQHLFWNVNILSYAFSNLTRLNGTAFLYFSLKILILCNSLTVLFRKWVLWCPHSLGMEKSSTRVRSKRVRIPDKTLIFHPNFAANMYICVFITYVLKCSVAVVFYPLWPLLTVTHQAPLLMQFSRQ